MHDPARYKPVSADGCHCTTVPSAAVAQHLSVFTSILGAAKGNSKRQLDCGGVVTTIVLACARLSAAHGHTDLADCRFQARGTSVPV